MQGDSSATSAGGGRLFARLLLAIGFFARLLPLFDLGGRLLRQFPTEDGYLMLTIARNLALGHGMSTAAGTLPTNGTQPLATLLWALCFRSVGGDKTAGVRLVLALSLVIASLAAWWIYCFARRVLAEAPTAKDTALLAAAVWYASPIVLPNTMNCLESGLYVALLAGALAYVVRAVCQHSERPRIARFMGLGLILGAAFWARNDAVLFCVAFGVTHLLGAFPGGTRKLAHRFLEMASTGLLVLGLAAPWLWFNVTRFGSIVPISGQAESMHATFGGNLGAVPANAFEYLSLVLPVPHLLDERPWVIAGTALALLGVLALLLGLGRRLGELPRAVSLFGVCLLLVFAAFYGLYFGAGHFMSRYLLVLSPLSALLWAAGVGKLRALLIERRLGFLATLVLPGACVLALGLAARGYRLGTQHQHFQVVEWVQQNVPDSVWVGAIQSGTLGFFHDRTLNLDGKVNPEALAAHKRGTILQYTVDSKAQYLVDWVGMTTWMSPPLSSAFEVLVQDPEHNLAVLRRRDPASAISP